MSHDCIFCKIVAGQIPSTKVYEDEHLLAFNDINPITPVHILLIPKRHLASVNELTSEDTAMLGHAFEAIQQIARQTGIADSGYRVATNTGKESGQVVFHLHFHIVGGRRLGPLA